jgi:hypothetical protein
MAALVRKVMPAAGSVRLAAVGLTLVLMETPSGLSLVDNPDAMSY